MFFWHDVGFQCARVSAQKNAMKFRKSTARRIYGSILPTSLGKWVLLIFWGLTWRLSMSCSWTFLMFQHVFLRSSRVFHNFSSFPLSFGLALKDIHVGVAIWSSPVLSYPDPAAKNWFPFSDSCRHAILRYPVLFYVFFHLGKSWSRGWG